LCRASERGQFCLTASREPSISGFGGARSQTSVAASYSYQLAEATSIAASASYQQTQSGFSTLPGAVQLDDQSYVSADVSVNRRLARRLSAYATVNYRDVNGLGLPVDADIGGRVGLSLTIGGR
jgi:predicted porin